MTSVIHRDTKTQKSGGRAAKVAHRDLDETAVSNLRARGYGAFLNVWLPLDRPIGTADPLALIQPRSVEVATDAVPFMGAGSDGTGLGHPPPDRAHDWVWVPGLSPGDALVWPSQIVFHASFQHPNDDGQGDGRRSADVRLHYRLTDHADEDDPLNQHGEEEEGSGEVCDQAVEGGDHTPV